MTRVLAVTNQKGGVGKTTTSVNLAASLAATGRATLLVDLDSQGNATTGCGVDKNNLEKSVYDLLVNQEPADEVLLRLDSLGFDLLPANGDLTAAEVALLNARNRETRLAEGLQSLTKGYEFVLIDCPPSLNMMTLNALTAADGVLIPMQCEYYALEGLAALMNTIEQIRETVNPRLEIEGLLRTMYDRRSSLTRDVSSQLEAHFGDKVYTAAIPRNVRLAEAPSYGMPVLSYDKRCRGALAYLALAGEVARRTRERKNNAAAEVA